MATNLRLRPDVHEALKREASSSGRSQQDVIRTAIERYLKDPHGNSADAVTLRPARTPFRSPARRISLPRGLSSLDLLERDDRI